MATREADILHSEGSFWVCRDRAKKLLLIMWDKLTHSVSEDVGYPDNPDGLSLAKARVSYLAGRVRRGEMRDPAHCL